MTDGARSEIFGPTASRSRSNSIADDGVAGKIAAILFQTGAVVARHECAFGVQSATLRLIGANQPPVTRYRYQMDNRRWTS